VVDIISVFTAFTRVVDERAESKDYSSTDLAMQAMMLKDHNLHLVMCKILMENKPL